MFKKNKLNNNVETVEIVKNKENNFSVFQVVIFAFLFILMIWIISFLSLELDGQKQQIQVLNNKVEQIEKGGVDLLENYIEKIRELQKIDIKEQVQQFGIDIKDNIQKVRELMFDKNDLSKLESKITRLEDFNKSYKGNNFLLLTISILLRDVVNKGYKFDTELMLLKKIDKDSEKVNLVYEKLFNYKDVGVKTENVIYNDFRDIMDDLVFNLKNSNFENNIKNRLIYRLKSFFKVRKVDFENSENNFDYKVYNIQELLKNGNLSDALDEILKIKNETKVVNNILEPLYNDLKNRIEVNKYVLMLINYSLEKALNDLTIIEQQGKEKILNK